MKIFGGFMRRENRSFGGKNLDSDSYEKALETLLKELDL